VTEANGAAGLSDAVWVWGFSLSGLLLLIAAGWATLNRRPTGAAARLLAMTALLWVPLAAVALVRVLAAYHYGVLHHHCPWCLFLPEHHGVGYPLFGSLAVAALEGPAAWAAAAISARFPSVAGAGAARVQQSGRWMVVAVFLFFLLSVGPALLWRLRFGVWMG
jgi:hypothetical protein